MPVVKLELPDRELLLQKFVYNPETGVLKRKSSGFVVGNRDELPYPRVVFMGRRYVPHRLIWKMMTEGPMPEEVDHINGNRRDNRWVNLRAATRSENMCNRINLKNNVSGFKGVGWRKDCQKWTARIRINKKLIHLGYFDDPALAHEVYLSSAKRLHGKFANDGHGPVSHGD